MLSTIILNWNRAYLLKKTVESYLETTIGADVELFVIDNASTDESRDYLEQLKDRAAVRLIYLEQNLGGEAYNLVIPQAKGELIHLSENDQEFLPGWVDHVIGAFDAFGDLGQLSLFSDVPTDEEAWVRKPSHMRFSGGKILYQAHANVGTSSILRAKLFREHGLKVANIEGPIKFPDDIRLSRDVKAAGYWAGWSDQYYVRNLGHFVEEFEAHPDYYESNYASKPQVGLQGWRDRIAQQKQLPKIRRSSIVLSNRSAVPEKTIHPVRGKPARLWSMFDGFTAEVEVLDFLFCLVRLVKPDRVIETGTWLGWSACVIGTALAANGFGKLTSLEINPEAHAVAMKNCHDYQIDKCVELLRMSSLDYAPSEMFDFAIFDSEMSLRHLEFERYRPWLRDGAIVIFHDTAPHHGVVLENVKALIASGAVTGIELPTPRGIFVGKVIPRDGTKEAL